MQSQQSKTRSDNTETQLEKNYQKAKTKKQNQKAKSKTKKQNQKQQTNADGQRFWRIVAETAFSVKSVLPVTSSPRRSARIVANPRQSVMVLIFI
jgi:hypothetical protein